MDIFLLMVNDNNQPLPENIPMAVEQENADSPQFLGEWEHSSSCYHCLDGRRKNEAHLNINNEMSPTIQQLFKMFFTDFVVGMIVPATCSCLHANKEC